MESCHSCCKISCCEISWTDFNLVNGTLLPIINAEWCFQTLRMGSKWGCGTCVLAHAHIAAPTCPLPMPMPACPVHQSSLYLPSSLIPQLPHQHQAIHLLLITAEPLKYCFTAAAGTATHWWYVYLRTETIRPHTFNQIYWDNNKKGEGYSSPSVHIPYVYSSRSVHIVYVYLRPT